MKKTTIFLIAFLLSPYCFGQTEFAPHGAEWTYSYSSFWGPPYSAVHVQYDGDTIIGSKKCKILRKHFEDWEGNFKKIAFPIYQSGDSIFFVASVSEEFTFYMFKNNMELGEVVHFPNLYGRKLRVQSIDTLVFNSQIVRRFNLEQVENGDFETHIYDKFGPEYGFFYSWLSIPWDGDEYYLRCYKENNYPQINLSNEDCYKNLTVYPSDGTNKKFLVFPNPVSETLNISSSYPFGDSNSMDVYDAAGRLFNLKFLNGSVNVGNLPVGFYVGQVKMGEQVCYFKFVKQ